jgi:hypothetical protein
MKAPVYGLLAAVGLAGGIELLALQNTDDVVYSPELAALNVALNAERPGLAIHRAELLYAHAPGVDAATTIIANNRTHLVSSQFVENDPRRGSPTDTITYLIDQSDGSALSWLTVPGGPIVVLANAVTEPEVDASMDAWTTVPCGGPGVAKVPDSGADPDILDGLVTGNPALIGTPFADMTHAGWLPGGFFNLLAPGGGTSILAATVTFVFIDGGGNPTDVNGDGFADVAFREIYYNRAFPWGTGGNESNVDIQSVSIHESGHAFGLGHFGKIFIKKNGQIQFAPKAIMNAVYISEDRGIRGTDRGSFCQIWANGK